MFRKFNINLMCIVICICALVTLTGYRYLNDIVCRPTTETITMLQNHSRIESRSYADTILDETRMMVKTEMWNYTYSHSGVDKLKDLVMESGGAPVRSIIVSTWRSGSSFLGDLVNAVPGTFYSYEPLKMFGVYNQIRGPPNADRATNLLKNILKCDFKNNTDFVKYFTNAKTKIKLANDFGHNKRFWYKCNHKRELCYDADFTSKFCKLFPFQAIKLDRFRLPLVKNILDEKELNAKVILLVRDPRGVIESRRHIEHFCSIRKVADCEEPRSVCSDMVKDYETAVNFLYEYPDRLMILRYEDLAFDLMEMTLKLLKFLKLEPTQSIHEFLKTHTTVSNSKHYSTFRVTESIPFKWKKTMKFDDVKEIQEKCREAMLLWGYEFAHNASHLTSKIFNPLLPYSVNQITRMSLIST